MIIGDQLLKRSFDKEEEGEEEKEEEVKEMEREEEEEEETGGGGRGVVWPASARTHACRRRTKIYRTPLINTVGSVLKPTLGTTTGLIVFSPNFFTEESVKIRISFISADQDPLTTV